MISKHCLVPQKYYTVYHRVFFLLRATLCSNSVRLCAPKYFKVFRRVSQSFFLTPCNFCAPPCDTVQQNPFHCVSTVPIAHCLSPCLSPVAYCPLPIAFPDCLTVEVAFNNEVFSLCSSGLSGKMVTFKIR